MSQLIDIGVRLDHALPFSVLHDVCRPTWNTVTSRRPIGVNIFDRDWELLVILDACRVDALRALANSIRWLDEVESVRSVGSMTPEWMLNTFRDDYRDQIARTAFVSGNIWSQRIFCDHFHKHQQHEYEGIHRGRPNWNPVSEETFAYFEQVYPFTEESLRLHPEGQIPHILTDRAIDVGREESFDRLIVHYGMPHLPFIADGLDWSPGEHSTDELMTGLEVLRELRPEEKSYDPAKQGEVSVDTVRKAYLRNLRLVLEYVKILLDNVDAETVVISADHGEAFGENGAWAHSFGWPFSPVKTVPWAKTTATDEGTYESTYDPLERTPTEQEQIDLLEEMGYL